MRKIALVSGILILFTVTAMAQGPGMGMLAEELSLTDQQKGQMESMAFQHQKQMIPLRADLKLAKLELREIMATARVDEKAAISKNEKISSIKAEISKMKLLHKLEMRKILTEEQQAKLKDLKREHRRHNRAGGRGPRAGNFDGPGPMPGMGPMGPGKGPAREIER